MTDAQVYARIDAYIRRLVEGSSPDAPLWNIESIRQGKPPRWNYIDGCMLTALLTLAESGSEPGYAVFAEHFVDHYVQEDGSIRGYSMEKFQLDDINEGRVLFDLFRATGKEKYRRAIEILHQQLEAQPRTCTGNFWHKKIYPHQVWLDGIYMAQVFAARYEAAFGNGDHTDVLRQIRTVRYSMFDERKGLLYHGMDCSGKAFWADPKTGLSKSFWLRAIGWFAAALADLIGEIGQENVRAELRSILKDVIGGIAPYADPETAMYYQVVDCGGREGNYLETSGSCMIAYAMLKGARLGALDHRYAAFGKRTFDGICRNFLRCDPDGDLSLGNICLVAGLGPETDRRRDGSYAYYISEPVVENDAKGVAPFVLCYTEIKMLG